jgi:phenylacetate-CoA ligase
MRYLSEPIETMTRKELEDFQLRKLKFFLNAVYKKNVFYREKFDKEGVRIDKIRSLEDFRRIVPFSYKKEFLKDQEDFPVYGRRLGVPLSEIVEFHLSSGTSGIGQEIYGFTATDVEYNGIGMGHHLFWSGLGYGDSVAVTQPLQITGAPYSYLAGIRKLGCKPFMIGTLDGKKRLEIMHRFGVNYFLATPVYLTRIMVTLDEMKVIPKEYISGLKTIALSAGSYPLEWAQRMEEIWGVRFSEFYACSSASSVVAPTCEMGIFRGRERRRGYLHLLENLYVVEVLDPDTLRPVESGEEGELVITTLDKVASPVVRFRTADKVRFFSHDHCECGRPFNLIECGSIARFDDMVKVKAMNIWPQAMDEVLFSYPEVEEYNAKVIVDEKGREVVKVIIEFKSKGDEERVGELLRMIAAQLQQKTGINMETTEGKPGEVTHFESKPKRLRDERQESLIKRIR